MVKGDKGTTGTRPVMVQTIETSRAGVDRYLKIEGLIAVRLERIVLAAHEATRPVGCIIGARRERPESSDC